MVRVLLRHAFWVLHKHVLQIFRRSIVSIRTTLSSWQRRRAVDWCSFLWNETSWTLMSMCRTGWGDRLSRAPTWAGGAGEVPLAVVCISKMSEASAAPDRTELLLQNLVHAADTWMNSESRRWRICSTAAPCDWGHIESYEATEDNARHHLSFGRGLLGQEAEHKGKWEIDGVGKAGSLRFLRLGLLQKKCIVHQRSGVWPLPQ